MTRSIVKSVLIILGILFLISSVIFTFIFFQKQELLPETDMALYHYAGYAPKDPSPGVDCRPVSPFRENLIGASVDIAARPESSFELGNSKFRIVTNNVRWVRLKDEVTAGKIRREEQRYCSNRVFYDTDVFKDGALIESIRFDNPSSCDEQEIRKDPIIKHVYQADGGSVNITFHATRDFAVSFYPDSRCGGHALVGHKIELQEPDDVFNVSIINVAIKDDIISQPGQRILQSESVTKAYTVKRLHVTIKMNTKYYPSLLGKVGVRIGVPTILGENVIEQEINTDTSGEFEFTNGREHSFIFNLTTDGGLIFTPYYEIYSSTSRLKELYGSSIFGEKLFYPNGIIKYRAADHRRFFVKKGEGQSYLVKIQNQTVTTEKSKQFEATTIPVLYPQTPQNIITKNDSIRSNQTKEDKEKDNDKDADKKSLKSKIEFKDILIWSIRILLSLVILIIIIFFFKKMSERREYYY